MYKIPRWVFFLSVIPFQLYVNCFIVPCNRGMKVHSDNVHLCRIRNSKSEMIYSRDCVGFAIFVNVNITSHYKKVRPGEQSYL